MKEILIFLTFIFTHSLWAIDNDMIVRDKVLLDHRSDIKAGALRAPHPHKTRDTAKHLTEPAKAIRSHKQTSEALRMKPSRYKRRPSQAKSPSR